MNTILMVRQAHHMGTEVRNLLRLISQLNWFTLKKAAIKREKSDARIDSSEREQARRSQYDNEPTNEASAEPSLLELCLARRRKREA